ncbi:MAG: thioredoxin domain-containing protein [Chitinophagaceae bacterium]|jgi:hypothetical protein|nr:thioredoxin domain-containing protein [Chitinophagaceae bacterium]
MPLHTNRLIHETSPYLLQHAHNPVDWYPWGAEALQRARDEDKPILVSIGYAACHWCHVMERESFEDPSTADIMNRHFINIKIDREERPDLDHIYMDAVQAIAGNGGWPLNVFLTPEAKPFFGGTYFPPVRAFNRASWKEVLTNIAQSYRDRREEIRGQADQLTEHLQKSNAFGLGMVSAIDIPLEEKFTRQQLQLAKENVMKAADRQWGGFSRAPKFPQAFTIQFLLRYHHAYGDEEALSQARLSLDKMIMGGIYDQAGGGFARYSTDTEWLAPHFEKMAYDNALLVGVLSEAFQLTGDSRYADTIRHTIGFMEREMLSPEGGFYAALDADSEGVEGKFYTWTYDEAKALLGEDFELMADTWDISPGGNWEHVNILRLRQPLEALALRHGLTVEALETRIAHARKILMDARARRVRPQLDDKILLGWNALMNTALSKSYAALGDPRLLELARSNMEFLLSVFADSQKGGLFHTYKHGEAKYPGFLDDYASLVEALLSLQELSGEARYIHLAGRLTEHVLDNFSEEEGPFFYYTPAGQADVIVRKKEVYDGAIPSGNAVMAWNLHRLGILLNRADWRQRSVDMLDAMVQTAVRYPNSFGVWVNLLLEMVQGTMEIVVLGPGAADGARDLLKRYIPHRVFQFSEKVLEGFPLMEGKDPAGDTTWYLCRDYACRRPVKTLLELTQLIDRGEESS